MKIILFIVLSIAAVIALLFALEEDETAMQLHVPVTEHLNCHKYCLHLWRPHGVEIPRPPGWMVAPTRPGKVA
jgi:hypothetical protein